MLPEHCAVHWLKQYIAYYKWEAYDIITEHLEAMMRCELPGPSLTTDNWALLEQKFGNECSSIVGNVTINFFSSVLEKQTPVNAMDCQHDTLCQEPILTATNNSYDNMNDYMECDMGMVGGLLSQEQCLTEEVQCDVVSV